MHFPALYGLKEYGTPKVSGLANAVDCGLAKTKEKTPGRDLPPGVFQATITRFPCSRIIRSLDYVEEVSLSTDIDLRHTNYTMYRACQLNSPVYTASIR